jgi:hypothetical protein
MWFSEGGSCSILEAVPQVRAEGVNGITSEVLRDGFQQLLQPPATLATARVVASAAIKPRWFPFHPMILITNS